MSRSRWCVAMVMLGVALLHVACAPKNRNMIVRDAPPPSFVEVAARYDERVSRLDRIWAIAVVELKYVDDRGGRQTEQGEGHLQIRQPSDFALNVGKLGEVYAYLGADAERFWFFDRSGESRVTVGRHENIGRECAEELGLPAHPFEMIALMGITSIGDAGSGAVAWSDNGAHMVVQVPRERHLERLTLDPETLLPERIEFIDGEGRVRVSSTLTLPAPVAQGDEGGFFPMMASRIEIEDPWSDTKAILHLADLEDGSSRRGRLNDVAFDFDFLRDAYRPSVIHVLDRDCPHPGWTP